MPFLDRGAVEIASRRSVLVEFMWATPDAELVAVSHAGGARVGWQVGSADEAAAARDAGCDLVVAQGIEVGGHVRGTTALLPLLAEVLTRVEVPVVAALYAGQSVGAVRSRQPAAEIVAEFVDEAERALRRQTP